MEKINNINPNRIKWCCDEYNINIDELSKDTGIALQSIEKLIQGTGGITFNQLNNIAKYFNRGILFFLEKDDVNENVVHTPQFRTITNKKLDLSPRIKTLVERAEKKRETYLNIIEDLGKKIFVKWDIPKLTIDDAKGSAIVVREWLQLNGKVDFQTYRSSVENKGVFVLVSNGYRGDWQIDKHDPVSGFSLYYPIYPIIMIKKQDTEERQSFTLIHELGHLLLHKDSFIDVEYDFSNYQQKEKIVNEFAGNILVPDSFLSQINIEKFPFDEVSSYNNYLQNHKKQWGVSYEVILRRMLEENILKPEQYNNYKKWQKGFTSKKQPSRVCRIRYKEPVKIFGRPFVGAVLEALYVQKISLTKASTYLDNLKISDIHKLGTSNVFI